jgi:hypothetical protein
LKQISTREQDYTYTTDDQELYNTITFMDSTFLHAYNSCDMDKQSAIYGDSLEFYHDKVLMTSKQGILDAKKNICGKVTENW